MFVFGHVDVTCSLKAKIRDFHNKSKHLLQCRKHQNVDILINIKTNHVYQARNERASFTYNNFERIYRIIDVNG